MERRFGFITGQNHLDVEMAYAEEHGFDHIEIDLLKEDTQLESFDRSRIHDLKKLTFDSQISLSLHIPYTLNLIRKNKISRNRLLSQINHIFDLAADLNATHITSHIGSFSKHVIWADSREKFLKRAIDNIQLISELADNRQLPFALENLIPLPAHSTYHFIGDNINDFSEIFSVISSENVGLCLDLGHANLNEGGSEYIKRFKSRIFCVHYHDNGGETDQHLGIGEGNIQWNKLIKELDKTGFSGPYISECFKSTPNITREKLLDLI